MVKISNFRDSYRFLSNFYQCPIDFEGLTYPNAEAAFQASKTLDPAAKIKYTQTKNPVIAKRMGRREQLRPDWEQVCYQVMDQVVRTKFSNPELAQLLLSTGDAYLEEGNHWHDNRWGKCSCDRCSKLEGQNWLGTILMNVRKELSENTVI